MGQKIDSLFEENEAFKQKFGFFLTEYRKIKGLTQEELAEKLNMVRQTISQTELGNTNCTVYNFYLLIHILDIPAEEVVRILYNTKYVPSNLLDGNTPE